MKNYFSHYCDFFLYEETDMHVFLDCPHTVEGCIVLLCTQGNAIITTGIIDNKIVKNAAMIILPGTTLYVVSASENFSAKIFAFSKDLYDETSLRLGISFVRYLRDTPFYVYPEESYLLKKVITWMDMAAIIYGEEQNEFKTIMVRNFLQNYLLSLYNECQLYFGHLIGHYTRQQEHFHQFLSLLDTYCREQRDVMFYANKLYISSRYLRKIVSRCTDFESPKEIIDRRFIVEIKVLLQSRKQSVQEVAEILNFPDQSYLGRYFKRHTDMSPTEYRNKMNLAHIQ